MRVTYTSRVAAPPDRVVAVLCSEPYNLEIEREREGVVATRFEPGESQPHRRTFRLVTTEHARTKTGGVDRSRTLHSTTTSEVDLVDRRLAWRYEASEASRVKLRGAVRVVAEGDGCRVEQEAEIEVSIPLLGGQIAKLIGKEFEKTFAHTSAVLARHVREAPEEV